MNQILAIILPVFSIVLVGYLYAQRYQPDMSVANRLNLEVFTPALILSVLAAEGFDLLAYTGLALAAAGVVLGAGLLAWPVARLMGWPLRTFLPPMMFNNSGNMGLPLAVFAFGEQALPAAMILFLVENTLHFTVGNAMLTRQFNPLSLIRMPMLLATLIGIVLSLANIVLPDVLYQTIDLIGQIAIPLMLFSLGVRMLAIDFSDWRIGMVGAIVCPLSGILIALPIAWLIGIEGTLLAQLLLFSVLPPAVLNFMLAEHYNIDRQRVAAIVLVGNLASVLVIPVTLYFVL
jgi:predicted permease